MLQFNGTFGWEMVVQHRKCSMFDKFVHGWSWCGGLIEERSASAH